MIQGATPTIGYSLQCQSMGPVKQWGKYCSCTAGVVSTSIIPAQLGKGYTLELDLLSYNGQTDLGL